MYETFPKEQLTRKLSTFTKVTAQTTPKSYKQANFKEQFKRVANCCRLSCQLSLKTWKLTRWLVKTSQRVSQLSVSYRQGQVMIRLGFDQNICVTRQKALDRIARPGFSSGRYNLGYNFSNFILHFCNTFHLRWGSAELLWSKKPLVTNTGALRIFRHPHGSNKTGLLTKCSVFVTNMGPTTRGL